MVLDTNVLLSLWVFADSRYRPLRAAVENGSWTQREILSEYAGIAEPVAQVACLPLPQCSDRDDQKFLELACNGAARLIVTSDKALLKLARHRIIAQTLALRILTPECFLEDCR